MVYKNVIGQTIALISHTNRMVTSVINETDLLTQARLEANGKRACNNRMVSRAIVEALLKFRYSFTKTEALPDRAMPSEYFIG